MVNVLNGDMNNMENLANSRIKEEFHKLFKFQHGKPKISLETENPDQIKLLLARQFTIIKEYVKQYQKESDGFFPSHSEGTCRHCSEKLIQILNGDLIWGWFTTDRKIGDEELKVSTNMGIRQIAVTNSEDRTQVSHWWVETGNILIDLTGEQFNRFLSDCSKKYDSIEVLKLEDDKATRYIGIDRHVDGYRSPTPY